MTRTVAAVGFSVLLATGALAQESADDLAKQLQNPVSSLISVPFQSNFDFNGGPNGDGRNWTTNVQPVIPITLNPDWNLIVRTILPITYRDNYTNGQEFGLGDTTQSFFLSPSKPTSGGLIWGVGPVFLWPSATDDSLGAQKWGVGPTAVVLTQQGPWTIGLLANHIWSYAGPRGRSDVSQTFMQPFVGYNFGGGWSVTLNTESSYDWQNDKVTVPLNLLVTKVFKISDQAMSFGVGGRYYAIKPEGAPDWGLRAQLTFLFPK